MKNIACKICVGCNSHIDRVKVFYDIRNALSGKYNVYTKADIGENEDIDLLVLINGCIPECHLPEHYPAYKSILINETNYNDAARIIEESV